jgi:hypothetical protein
MAQHNVESAVERATNSDVFEYAARAGFAVSGVLHLAIGYIILHIAFGAGGTADQSGALATLAATPGGAAVLWIAATGLLALALWRLAEAVIGPHPGEIGDEERGAARMRKRGKSLALAVVYLAIAYSAVRFATGGGEASSRRNAELSAKMMQSNAGKAALILIGLAIVAVGGYHVYKGITKRFLKDLKVAGGPRVTPIGVAGYTAKGVVFTGAGILVIVATLTADPAKASGVDAAVKTFGAAPFGKTLLILAAVGIAAFGVYCFVRSRYARM